MKSKASEMNDKLMFGEHVKSTTCGFMIYEMMNTEIRYREIILIDQLFLLSSQKKVLESNQNIRIEFRDRASVYIALLSANSPIQGGLLLSFITIEFA